mmetsp:Transcript_100677/g.285297  ORF Transcript_100677/g.285297 Transcript_100677/m.285297 type:complete len:246 (+) Transcript_100677:437-1174(+)
MSRSTSSSSSIRWSWTRCTMTECSSASVGANPAGGGGKSGGLGGGEGLLSSSACILGWSWSASWPLEPPRRDLSVDLSTPVAAKTPCARNLSSLSCSTSSSASFRIASILFFFCMYLPATSSGSEDSATTCSSGSPMSCSVSLPTSFTPLIELMYVRMKMYGALWPIPSVTSPISNVTTLYVSTQIAMKVLRSKRSITTMYENMSNGPSTSLYMKIGSRSTPPPGITMTAKKDPTMVEKRLDSSP